MKKLYNNNQFKASTPTWNKKFELPERSCSILDILDIKYFFKYIVKKHETLTDNRKPGCI